MGNGLSLRSLLGATSLPQNEARILMAYVIDIHYQLPRSALLSHDELELNQKALEKWKSLESRRLQGEPIAYLLAKKGFHNIELYVAPGVLIPRPETELLVEIGLQEIERLPAPTRVLDLGTGSGAIALAVAQSASKAMVTATDQSLEALKIAKTNLELLGLEDQVQLLQGSWYEALADQTRFEIILSNPPYIAKNDPHLAQGDLRFEPILALTDEADGLECIRNIVNGAKKYLSPNGLLAIEHGYDQSDTVLELMNLAGFTKIQAHCDLAGHKRVASGRNIDT